MGCRWRWWWAAPPFSWWTSNALSGCNGRLQGRFPPRRPSAGPRWGGCRRPSAGPGPGRREFPSHPPRCARYPAHRERLRSAGDGALPVRGPLPLPGDPGGQVRPVPLLQGNAQLQQAQLVPAGDAGKQGLGRLPGGLTRFLPALHQAPRKGPPMGPSCCSPRTPPPCWRRCAPGARSSPSWERGPGPLPWLPPGGGRAPAGPPRPTAATANASRATPW